MEAEQLDEGIVDTFRISRRGTAHTLPFPSALRTAPELVEEAYRMHDAIPPAERPQHDAYLSIFGVADAPEGGTMSEGQFTLGWLAFNKFGKSIVELAAGDAAGGEKSSRQLLSVQRDYQNWRYGKLDVNKMHFKFGSHHILIMQTGLELGFRDLSPNQLADCYDEVCNCGETHDPENMKKLRTRVIKIRDPRSVCVSAISAYSESIGSWFTELWWAR